MVLHPDLLSSFVWSRYIWSIFFCNWTLSTRLLEKQADYQRRLYELYRGFLGHAPREKFWRIGLAETPYPAFPGSNATNLYGYFVELFSESRYSWIPSRSPWKNHDSRVFKTKIHGSYMFRKYDSWFMIPLPPPILFNVATIYPQFFFDIHWCSVPYSPVCRNNLPIRLTLKVLSYVCKQSGWSWRKCQTSTIRPSRYSSCGLDHFNRLLARGWGGGL